AQGRFLWPGYGENLRVLAWMIDRCNGKVSAAEVAIGRGPHVAHLDTRGLDVTQEALAALLAGDPALWRKGVAEFRQYLGKYGNRLPAALLAELQTTEARLN